MDDIVRTVRGEPSCLLDAANSFHPNLQSTLGKNNSDLPFLDFIGGIGANPRTFLENNKYVMHWFFLYWKHTVFSTH